MSEMFNCLTNIKIPVYAGQLIYHSHGVTGYITSWLEYGIVWQNDLGELLHPGALWAITAPKSNFSL